MRIIVLPAISLAFVFSLGLLSDQSPANAAANCNLAEGDKVELVGVVTDRGSKNDEDHAIAIEQVTLDRCPDTYFKVSTDPAPIPETCIADHKISGSGTVTSTHDWRGYKRTLFDTFGIVFYLVHADAVRCQ